MDSGKIRSQLEMLANRLIKRQKHLKKWAHRTGAGAYRLYDKDIPEIPLVLDYYRNNEVQAISGALYKRPYEKEANEEQQWLLCMKETIADTLSIKPDHIFIKTREKQKNAEAYDGEKTGDSIGRASENGTKSLRPQYQKIAALRFDMNIQENEYLLKVNLSDYIDTGLFLDLRKLRKLVKEEASGKKILNLFCYTGSFSVAAAQGGAALVDSVDISNTYLQWTHDNFELNNLHAEYAGYAGRGPWSSSNKVTHKTCAGYRLIREDVFRFLDRPAADHRYDIIILDPPIFSRSKKMEGTLDIKRDFLTLLSRCFNILNPNGIIYFSVKAKTFRLDEASLRASYKNITLTDISEKIRDEDFKGKRLSPVYRIERSKVG
ncbi:MAG: class I SAM-dependent methyltransferase [Spirochaetaceae bacterium]|jgi:23S rRNA G2069 N7-methylase RlmK/C1962 C5-methylase RlmI|nr:class I SAM-dependent methyltransferase [Spirochaetaceae bacterium]